MPPETSNRLIHATSPYLLQHAHNPVDWYEWGEEALQKARDEDKPILLSIGYSACHWCHVMAHESFEDPGTAELMNRLYVNIKVDREERPDLDKIYQLAQQMLTQKTGGWPLNMIITPDDHIPLYGGTYFPREPRFNLPAFSTILERVAEFYTQHKDDTAQHKDAFRQHLQHIDAVPEPLDGALSDAPLDSALEQLRGQFDTRHGGFGGAPKFPQVTNLEFLIRYARRPAQGAEDALQMTGYSLERMIRGGLYDHLGGGFCRYSVDERWEIPHFEKMLYDNGPLLALCTRLWQISGRPLFQQAATETADWVLREMQSREGGYFSTLDADSEGEEGRFYVWNRNQLQAVLEEDFELAAACFGLNREPNFEGRWHLILAADREQLAEQFGMTAEAIDQALARIKSALFKVREGRIRPGRDEKILTAWNGLMIRGMAIAGRVFGREDWLDSAQKSLGFVRQHLWQDGRLLATCKDGRAHLSAYLDDYAFLIDAILELLQARWRSQDLAWARQLADVLCEHFEDREHGGFYFTADDHEALIQRPKPMTDDSMASGNGIAALALNRLGHLLGEDRYVTAAEKTLRAAWASVLQMPMAHGALLCALTEAIEPPEILIVRGTSEAALQDWRQQSAAHFEPSRLCFVIPSDAPDLPPALADKHTDQPALGWLCAGTRCQPPVKSWSDLEQA